MTPLNDHVFSCHTSLLSIASEKEASWAVLDVDTCKMKSMNKSYLSKTFLHMDSECKNKELIEAINQSIYQSIVTNMSTNMGIVPTQYILQFT